MRVTLCCLLALGVISVGGCSATQNNFASKVKSEGAQHLDLSQQWEQGEKDVKAGSEQLRDGRQLVQEGSNEIREGERLIAEAQLASERHRQAFVAFSGNLQGAQSAKRAAEMLQKLEEINDLWEDADEKYLDGKEQIEDGNTKLAEGESAIEQGQSLVNSGRNRMSQAEAKYQQRTGKGLVEQMHIEEQPRNF